MGQIDYWWRDYIFFAVRAESHLHCVEFAELCAAERRGEW
jgi:hypothetical protein